MAEQAIANDVEIVTLDDSVENKAVFFVLLLNNIQIGRFLEQNAKIRPNWESNMGLFYFTY
jgi:hypothetical protein